MAHQTHTLPWTLLATHFKYQPPKCHIKPYHAQSHDITTTQKPTQTQDVKFFATAFATAISSFSLPLRAKYPPKEHYKEIGVKWTTTFLTEGELPSGNGRRVFSNEIKEKYPGSEGINFAYALSSGKTYQDVQSWISRGIVRPDGALVYWDWDERELPAVIKVLIHEASHILEKRDKGGKWKVGSGDVRAKERDQLCDEAIETLLRMANHPKIPLASIKESGRYYHAGINSIAKSCLQAYLMLNIFVALKEAGSDINAEMPWGSTRPQPETFVVKKKYMLCRSYKRMVYNCTADYDLTGCMGVHAAFLRGSDPKVSPSLNTAEVDVLADIEKLKEYLKGLWRILVVYDLLMRETSEDSEGEDWETEVMRAL
ncbi:hypothetical protein BGZ60DRAFT_524026 [Tricladium varicosporioides]|nr:hypothetical protein BGZ60DRAFT_524026 [Hymenoscyphus varicosporioides]